MNRFDVMHVAFQDELEKIAGHIRVGRRPISVGKLLKKEGTMVKRSITEKLGSATGKALRGHPFLTGIVAGAAGLHVSKKMNEDRKVGRQIRIQQRNQGY